MNSTSSHRLYRRFALVGLSCVLSLCANLANALPFALRDCGTEDSQLKGKLIDWVNERKIFGAEIAYFRQPFRITNAESHHWILIDVKMGEIENRKRLCPIVVCANSGKTNLGFQKHFLSYV
jgi:hypothetical protein